MTTRILPNRTWTDGNGTFTYGVVTSVTDAQANIYLAQGVASRYDALPVSPLIGQSQGSTLATYSTDSQGNVTGLVGKGGLPLFQNQLPNPSRYTGYEFSTFYNRPATDYQIVGAGSAAAVSTTFARTGSQTLAVTLNRGSATTTDINPLYSWTNFVCFNGRIGIWVYVPDYTLLSTFVLKVSHGDATFTNGAFQSYNFADLNKTYNGWHFVGFDKAEFTGVYGTPNWSAVIGTFRLTMGQNSATPVTVYLDNGVAAWHAKGKVLVTFDDGYRNAFNYGFPTLDSMAIKATASIIAAQIDSNNTWATSSQLSAAYANGHDLAVHGATALNNGVFTSDALRIADIQSNQNYLINHGWTRASNFYVWPNGVYNLAGSPDQLPNLIKSLGFVAGRGTSTPVFYKHGPGKNDMAYFAPVFGAAAADTIASITGYIDNVATYGCTGFLMYHEIVPGGASGSTQRNLSDFVQEMEYLAAKRDAGLIDIVTASQWIAAL